MQTLYEVIIETQKARTDLLKWKLLISAGLGAGAFGIDSSVRDAEVLLCLIPLASFYVDLLCSHLSIRIQVIGAFVRTCSALEPQQRLLRDYEHFVALVRDVETSWGRTNALSLEYWAMYAASFVLSGLVLGFGVLGAASPRGVFLFSGVTGLILTEWVRRNYTRKLAAVRATETQLRDRSDGNAQV